MPQLGNNSSQLGNNSSQLGNNSSQLGNNSSQLGNNSSQLGNNSSQLGNRHLLVKPAKYLPVIQSFGAQTAMCNEVVFAYLCSCCGFFDDLYLPWVACKCACHDALCVCRMFGLYICLPIVYHNFRCLRLRMRASCIPLSFSCTAYNNLVSSSAFCFLVGLVLK